jgi:hypothetical protein
MDMHYTQIGKGYSLLKTSENIWKRLAYTQIWYILTLSIPIFSSTLSALLIYFCEKRYLP